MSIRACAAAKAVFEYLASGNHSFRAAHAAQRSKRSSPESKHRERLLRESPSCVARTFPHERNEFVNCTNASRSRQHRQKVPPARNQRRGQRLAQSVRQSPVLLAFCRPGRTDQRNSRHRLLARQWMRRIGRRSFGSCAHYPKPGARSQTLYREGDKQEKPAICGLCLSH